MSAMVIVEQPDGSLANGSGKCGEGSGSRGNKSINSVAKQIFTTLLQSMEGQARTIVEEMEVSVDLKRKRGNNEADVAPSFSDNKLITNGSFLLQEAGVAKMQPRQEP